MHVEWYNINYNMKQPYRYKSLYSWKKGLFIVSSYNYNPGSGAETCRSLHFIGGSLEVGGEIMSWKCVMFHKYSQDHAKYL